MHGAAPLPISSASRLRPRCVSVKRRNANFFQRACAGKNIKRNNSPGPRMFWSLPVTKSTTGDWRGLPPLGQSVHTPSRHAVSEIVGQAGSDMQTLPPTVASFQISNEERNDRQHRRKSGATVQSVFTLSAS